MKTKKAILFDLFSTLITCSKMEEAWEDWTLFICEKLQPYGLNQNIEEFRETFGKLFELPLEPETEKIGTFTKYERRLYQFFIKQGLNIPPKQINSIADHSVPVWARHFSLETDTADLLQNLKRNYKIALVSNFDHPPAVHDLLKEKRIHDYFNVITVSGELNIDKPDPRIFFHTLEQLGIKPEEAVHIGDDYNADITGARAADITPVLIDRNGTNKHAGDCISISKLTALKDLDLEKAAYS